MSVVFDKVLAARGLNCPMPLVNARKEIAKLEEMISLARDLGVRMTVCEMSRDLMGIGDVELVAGLECGGVGAFLADSLKSRATLFI